MPLSHLLDALGMQFNLLHSSPLHRTCGRSSYHIVFYYMAHAHIMWPQLISHMYRTMYPSTCTRELILIRVSSPVLEPDILCQYLTYQTARLPFQSILQIIELNFFQLHPYYVALGLHGRIPVEPVRPRRTVQSHVYHGCTRSQDMYRATRHNPELGSYSIWVMM